MLRDFYSYFCKTKLRQWPFFMILSSSCLILLLYSSNKRITFSLDSPKTLKKKKERKMIDRVSQLFDKFKSYDTECNARILIRDSENCRNKINDMIEDGTEWLQVISDFDRTISSYLCNGQPNLTCHGVFETDPELSPETQEECNMLRDTYYPIEVDTTMTDDQKIPYMIEWWSKAHDLMVRSRLHRDVLESTVQQCDIGLREGSTDFMKQLCVHNIPILIFSAGIGNVIQEILRFKRMLNDNVRIVSNFMNFNSEGILTGFQDDIIHSFNKSARSIQDSEFYENICTQRRNVILMGDSTGDPHMADGLSDNANVLKIGFLNSNVEELKEKYMSLYDIVLVCDETFVVPNMILNSILNI